MIDPKKERKLYHAERHLENQRKQARDEFVRSALATIEGREYFYWLLALCHVGHQPFTLDSHSTAFNCGELNVGLAVQSHIIEAAPDNWLSLLKEKEEERLRVERERTGLDDDSTD